MTGNESSHPELTTITTTAYRCRNCETRRVGSYHDGEQCDGLVIRAGDGWQCANCGVSIRPATNCLHCGGAGSQSATDAIVDLRPPVPTTAIETALRRRIATLTAADLKPEPPLTAIARSHSHAVVERRSFGGADATPSLTDRLEEHDIAVAKCQAQQIEAYPPDRTPDRIAQYIVREFDFPVGGDATWTHLGTGVATDPTGGIYVSLVFAVRAATVNPAALERAIHEATNARRREHGVGSLTFDHHLAGVARAHSRDMAHRDFFAHETPDGETPADRYQRAEYDSTAASENLSKRYPSSESTLDEIAAGVVDSWMNSRGHRENLLTSTWDTEGIGAFRRSDGGVFVTQNFS